MQDVELMQHCLEIGQEAYNQEKSRQAVIVQKAEYLMKYHTLLVAILNLSLPLILRYVRIENSTWWIVFYIVTMAVLLSGIICTLFIQFPKKLLLFPTSASVLKRVKANREQYDTQEAWIYKKILMWEKVTVSLEEANDSAVQWIKRAYIAFSLSILGLGFFFGSIIVLSS